jgi:hypothetical protein
MACDPAPEHLAELSTWTSRRPAARGHGLTWEIYAAVHAVGTGAARAIGISSDLHKRWTTICPPFVQQAAFAVFRGVLSWPVKGRCLPLWAFLVVCHPENWTSAGVDLRKAASRQG